MSIQEQLMEYMIQDIVEMITNNQGLEYDEALNKFYNSEIFEKIKDGETGLYRESSAYVYDLFRDEICMNRQEKCQRKKERQWDCLNQKRNDGLKRVRT